MNSINWSHLGWSLLIIAIGVIVILVIGDSGWGERWQILVTQLFSIIIITTALNIIWEQYSKERFKKEILGAKSFADEIERAGLKKIPSTKGFNEEIDWEKHFNEVRNLDLFVSWGYSWRQNNRLRLKNFAEREDTKANIILPDYEEEQIVAQLAQWFTMDTEDVVKEIKKSAKDFDKLFNDKEVDYQILLANTTPVYSFYRFDHVGILALYKHRNEKVGVTSLIVEEGGSLYDYISKDLKFLKKNSRKFENEE